MNRVVFYDDEDNELDFHVNKDADLYIQIGRRDTDSLQSGWITLTIGDVEKLIHALEETKEEMVDALAEIYPAVQKGQDLSDTRGGSAGTGNGAKGDRVVRNVPFMGIINHGAAIDEFEKDFSVVCASCEEMTLVRERLEINGKTAYHLACGHQNAVCVRHSRLVKDGTDTSNDAFPLCDLCFAEQED